MSRRICAVAATVMCVAAAASASGESHVSRAIANADEKLKARRPWVHDRLLNNLTLHDGMAVALLAPVFQCPWTLRQSSDTSQVYNDGFKWTCGLPEMVNRTKPCIVYSFGSNGQDEFERDTYSVNPACEIHVFDPTSPPIDRWHFHEYGLCARDGNFTGVNRTSNEPATFPCKSLATIMAELGHRHVDLLKADVEGAEWGVIEETDWDALRVGQIAFELHDFDAKIPITDLFDKYIGRLERAGFLMFSIEPVAIACRGQYEVAFIHRHWRPSGVHAQPNVTSL